MTCFHLLFLNARLVIRGVYFACIVFHEDKVLVTTEEFPPVVEVDDTYPASVNNDFHWLMKVHLVLFSRLISALKLILLNKATLDLFVDRSAVRGVT